MPITPKNVTRCITIVILAAGLFGCAGGYSAGSARLVSGGIGVENLVYAPEPRLPGVRYPGVVICHGGSDGVDYAARSMARELAGLGFVVVLPQFRGQGGSEGVFEFGRGEVDDAVAALEYLRGLEYVDGGRVGMAGAGLGGLVALRALGRVQGIGAAVLMASISDPVAYFEQEWAMKGGDRHGQLKRHIRHAAPSSPTPTLALIDAPVLVLHGDDDRAVSSEQSRELCETLAGLGKDAQIKVYPGVGHDILMDYRARKDAADFLERRLKR